MRPPRSTLVTAAASVALAAAAIAGTTSAAQADLGVPVPSVTPLPSVSVSVSVPVPLPTPTAPVPQPSVSVPGTGSGPLPSDDATARPGGSGGTGGSGPEANPAGTSSGGAAAAGASGTTATDADKRASKHAKRAKRAKRKADATPLIAGTAAAAGFVDDESSPALFQASQAFLAADQSIADIANQKKAIVRLQESAKSSATLYRAMGYDVLTARSRANTLHGSYADLGTNTTGKAARRLADGATRADLRLGELIVGRELVKADYKALVTRTHGAKAALEVASQQLTALAAVRSSALGAIQAAGAGDIALTQARLAESGQLGAQIESLSEQLARRGDTVEGTGHFAHPLDGSITSPFGMRFHPILHYTKLHTGTDFAGGSVIHAADDGRVIMTVVSAAYGNFTVIDHGIVDGERLTTAYAHQSAFLVKVGQKVAKGEQIGIVGATGFATGPHLHFEVRRDGTVVDPMMWLAR